jgi:hypothetical protein
MYSNKTFIGAILAFILLASVLPLGIVTAGTPTPEQVNDYSLEIANLVKEKCHGNCKNVVLLGDDYVIPSFRRDIKMSPWYELFGNWFKPRTDNILTDIGYVQRNAILFSDFDKMFIQRNWMGVEEKGKDIVLIIPRDYDANILQEIDRFEDMLKDNNYALDVSRRYDDQVACNDPQLRNNFNGVTLFIFGTDNQALDCFPFVAKLEDTAFIDINPWDGRNYAVIIQSDSKDVLQTLRVAIDSGAYKKLQSEWITFVDTVLVFASIAATFVGADTIVDGIDASFQCFVVKNVIACGASTTTVAIPLVPSGSVKIAVKKFISYVGNAAGKFFIRHGGDAYATFARLLLRGQLDNFKIYYKEVTNYFGDNWDVIVKKLNWGAADEVLASQGAKRVGDLGTFAPHLAKEVQVDLLHTVGKSGEALKLGDNAVKEIKFVDELIDPNTGKALVGVPAIFDPNSQKIFIKKGTKISDLKDFLIAHEMAHAEVFDKVGDLTEMVIGMSPNNAKLAVEEFDEFLAQNLAKDKLGADFVLNKLTDADIKTKAGDIVARHLALARTYDSAEAERILNLVSQQRVDGSKIIHLSETFLDNSNLANLKNNPDLITKIAKEAEQFIS